jgi:hypothetical protein
VRTNVVQYERRRNIDYCFAGYKDVAIAPGGYYKTLVSQLR